MFAKKKKKEPLSKGQISAMDKARSLLVWLREQQVTEDIRLDSCTVITNYKLFLYSHASGIENTEPLSLIWRNYYMRLYELKKKLIENENNNSKI